MLWHFPPLCDSPPSSEGNLLWEPGTISHHGPGWCSGFRGKSNCITTQCLSLLPGNPARPSTSLNKQLISRWFKSLFNSLYNNMFILWPKPHPFWKNTDSYCKPYPSEALNANCREMLSPGTNWVTPMWVGAWISLTVAKNVLKNVLKKGGKERERLEGSYRYLTVSRFSRSLWPRRHFTSQKCWCDLHIRRYKEALAGC